MGRKQLQFSPLCNFIPYEIMSFASFVLYLLFPLYFFGCRIKETFFVWKPNNCLQYHWSLIYCQLLMTFTPIGGTKYAWWRYWNLYNLLTYAFWVTDMGNISFYTQIYCLSWDLASWLSSIHLLGMKFFLLRTPLSYIISCVMECRVECRYELHF